MANVFEIGWHLGTRLTDFNLNVDTHTGAADGNVTVLGHMALTTSTCAHTTPQVRRFGKCAQAFPPRTFSRKPNGVAGRDGGR